MSSDDDAPREENNSPCDIGAHPPRNWQHTPLIPMVNTFSKDERLNKGDFRGTRWNRGRETPHFILLLSPNGERQRKLGVTIRKKLGGAVVRNRMRRLVKEFYRLNRDLFPQCHNNLVKIKQVPERTTWTEIEKELHQLLQVNTFSKKS